MQKNGSGFCFPPAHSRSVVSPWVGPCSFSKMCINSRCPQLRRPQGGPLRLTHTKQHHGVVSRSGNDPAKARPSSLSGKPVSLWSLPAAGSGYGVLHVFRISRNRPVILFVVIVHFSILICSRGFAICRFFSLDVWCRLLNKRSAGISVPLSVLYFL